MMCKFFIAGAVALACMQAAIGQQQYGNAVEARAMLKRVIVGIKADPAETIAQINKSDPKFSDRDLCPLCWSGWQNGCKPESGAPWHCSKRQARTLQESPTVKNWPRPKKEFS